MSSLFVRESIEDFIALEFPLESLVDVTADYEELNDMLEDSGVTPGSKWLGIQYVGSEESQVDISGTNTHGTWREYGIIYLHIVDISQTNIHRPILVRAEALRSKFRSRRINSSIVIESVSPCNFGAGISLEFEGGYTSGLVEIAYRRDLIL